VLTCLTTCAEIVAEVGKVHVRLVTEGVRLVAEGVRLVAEVGKAHVRLFLILLNLSFDLLDLCLDLLELLQNSIALNNRRKIGKISQLVGNLLESLREEHEIRLRTVCHGFESWE